MNSLRIPIAELADQDLSIDATVPAASLIGERVEAVPVADVRVRGTMSQVGAEYLFQGRVSGEYAHPCDRCLGEARVPFESKVIWNFEEREANPAQADTVPGDEDDASGAFQTFEGTEIDLGPIVWEEMVLGIPIKYLCSADCKGLCPQCGANLNEGPCACGDDTGERLGDVKGFAGLKEMFPELKQGPEKE